MLGYVNINQKMLNKEAEEDYQGMTCGLCRQLKLTCGAKGQQLLTSDMIFLTILLSGLYELESEELQFVCTAHPSKRKIAICNEATVYAADMSLLLASGDPSRRSLAKALDKECQRVREEYPRQYAAVEEYWIKADEAVQKKESNIDAITGLKGEMLGEIFTWKEDVWADELRSLGYYLGKYIYLMDAYEEMEKDKKKKEYNPLYLLRPEQEQDLDTFTRLILTSMVSECVRSFERLPVLMHADILRNILYTGIWTRYDLLSQKRKKEAKPRKK